MKELDVDKAANLFLEAAEEAAESGLSADLRANLYQLGLIIAITEIHRLAKTGSNPDPLALTLIQQIELLCSGEVDADKLSSGLDDAKARLEDVTQEKD